MAFVRKTVLSVWALALFWGCAPSFAQKAEVEALLPPDHLLENPLWWSEGGKGETKGLFSFEEMGALGTRNLIFVYRPAAAVGDLDKPHTQTLAVCLYNPVTRKYSKIFEDEGGPIEWIKVLKDGGRNLTFLILERNDLKGGQEVRGFLEDRGSMRQVMQVLALRIFTNFREGSKGQEIWCSSKSFPSGKGEAEHVFTWNDEKLRFQDEKLVAEAPGIWSGFSILVPTPTPIPTPIPTPLPVVREEEKPKEPSPVKAAALPRRRAVVAVGEPKSWWDKPLNPAEALKKLKTEIVPQSIRQGKMPQLGQMANAFFQEAKRQGVVGKDFLTMRAEYFAAVASTLADEGKADQAEYYLKIASKIQPEDPDVLQARKKIGGGALKR